MPNLISKYIENLKKNMKTALTIKDKITQLPTIVHYGTYQ